MDAIFLQLLMISAKGSDLIRSAKIIKR